MQAYTRSESRGGRQYICRARREHDPAHADYCAAPILDAATVDRVVLLNLRVLLNDATAMREQLLVGRRAELAKYEHTAEQARIEAVAAERAADRADELLARGLGGEDEATLIRAARLARRDAVRGRTLMDAALDRLTFSQEEPEPDQAGVMARLWDALSGEIADAAGDVKLLNAALREYLRFELSIGPDGHPEIALAFSAAGLARAGYDAPASPPRITGEYGLLRFS